MDRFKEKNSAKRRLEYYSTSRYGTTRVSKPEIAREDLIGLLRKMREIRQFSERIISIYPTDVMVTPVHLCIGQEAVPVGVCAHLQPVDTIFFGHRTHGPALAKGMDMQRLMAELYGRVTGCSRGFGGSMHVIDPPNGMLGSSAIVGGCIALGVGSALAAKFKGEERISVSYFGDGATNSGVFWESMNFSALKELPVVFVCENNSLSNTMPVWDHTFAELTSVAEKFMLAFYADGTDVLTVYAAAKDAVAYVREEGKPAFLECRTKRWMKHQGVEADDLPYNPFDRQFDCPIKKLEHWMLANNLITEEEVQEMTERIESSIEAAIDFAVSSAFPKESDLLKEV